MDNRLGQSYHRDRSGGPCGRDGSSGLFNAQWFGHMYRTYHVFMYFFKKIDWLAKHTFLSYLFYHQTFHMRIPKPPGEDAKSGGKLIGNI